MNDLSARANNVGHFLAMEILERALEMEARGEDIVHLEIGEPDFPTPARAIAAGRAAIDRGRTRYTHSLGVAPLRDAIATRSSKDYGVWIGPERVVVTMGSSAALVLLFAALLDPGDEVIVPDPGYPCYPNIARALGAVPRPVPVGPDTGFSYDPGDVRRAIGARTKAIVVNSPSNPTGTLTPPDVLAELCSLGPRVVSDEIYHGLVYEGTARSVLEFDDGALVVGGFSKLYAMTGWRIGYAIVPDRLMRHVQALQQNMFISASDFGQWAALEAMDADDDVAAMVAEYDRRRRFLVPAIESAGLTVPVHPVGAFYVFADARRFTDDSLTLAGDILKHAKVAVTPGVDFGGRGEGFLRFSYANDIERLREGIRRVAAYLGNR